MASPLTIKVPCCYAEEWKCKLEEMCLGPKKHKRDEMEQHEPGDAAGGQIISGLKVVASVYDACKDSFVVMESLYSMSACGHPESSSSTHSPSYPCSWNTSPIPGRLDVSMTLDARFTMLFISGILLRNGGNIPAGV